eukprot:symbB.v1.2.020034.t1/scaffold1658.1/size109791/6
MEPKTHHGYEESPDSPNVQSRALSYPAPDLWKEEDRKKAPVRRGHSAPLRKDAVWTEWHFRLNNARTHQRPVSTGTLPELNGCNLPLPLSCAELAQMISRGDPRLVVVDVRGTDFFFLGKVPGCWHIAYEAFPQKLANLVIHCCQPWQRAVFCSFDGSRRSIDCARQFQRAVSACYRKEACCSSFYLRGGIKAWAEFCEAVNFEGGLVKASVIEAIAFAQESYED